MKTIYKYHIERTDRQLIVLSVDARTIHVGLQNNELYLWAEVSTDALLEQRTIYVRGTGHPFIGTEGRHLGTVMDGLFVWHIYEAL